MIDGNEIRAMSGLPRARTLTEARNNGRHAAAIYGRAVEAYPATAIFNTTDVRLLVRCIEDLIRDGD